MVHSSRQNEIAPNIQELKDRIDQLESLVDTISRGKMAWQSTFDVITDPVMIIDEDYNVTRANNALAKAADMDVRKVIGRKCYEVFAGRDTPCRKCPVLDTLKSGKPHSTELEPFAKNDGHYYVNAYSMPTLQGKREMVLHYRSIGEEKILQKKLFQAEKMAAVGTLAGGIAHEINNPLGAILAFTQLVMQDLDKDHECQNDLKEIEQATQRCRVIVKDLLDFSRQHHDEDQQEVNLNTVIQKSMAMVNVNAKDKTVQIETELDENLPNIKGHLHKLQQVLLNFVSNGIDAMKKRGGVLKIKTYADLSKKRVFLEVADNGDGIPDNILSKIFDPYFTTKAQGEGTGLGLPISYKIIQEHKGTISVKSDVGKGTKFIVSLPMI